jgi:hypothetical protein
VIEKLNYWGISVIPELMANKKQGAGRSNGELKVIKEQESFETN